MRVLVGRLFFESHAFNSVPTRASDFTVLRGPDLLATAPGSTLGGIITVLRHAGVEPVPTLAAVARPGGPIQHPVYEDFKAEILAVARRQPIDAVAFELHGAITTDCLHDVEGDLLGALRHTLGPQVVIGVGIDLHAHVTPAMLRAADVVTACKQNPHADMVETGERTAKLVLDTLAGRIRPVTALVKLPMVLRGGLETNDLPLVDLHKRARDWLAREPRLLDISICNVHAYLDVPGLGQAILAIADGEGHIAAAAATDIATHMWDVRDRFADTFPSIDGALDTVLARPEQRPWVLADRGDRVLAGAPGDDVAILRRLIDRRLGLRAAVPITHPRAVAAAQDAGVGGEVRLQLEGQIPPGVQPLPVTGRVLALTDGRFVMRGPFQAGQPSCLGDTAVVAVDRVKLLLTSLAGLTQDPEAFESQGIQIAAQDLLVVKSGYHFKLSFAGLATPLVVDTPGMTNWRPGLFQYRHARPFYPEDDVCLNRIETQVFSIPHGQKRCSVAPAQCPDT